MIGRLGIARLTIAGCGVGIACWIICDAKACMIRESGDQGSRREGCCELVAVEWIPVIGGNEGISPSPGFGRESIGGIGAAL